MYHFLSYHLYISFTLFPSKWNTQYPYQKISSKINLSEWIQLSLFPSWCLWSVTRFRASTWGQNFQEGARGFSSRKTRAAPWIHASVGGADLDPEREVPAEPPHTVTYRILQTAWVWTLPGCLCPPCQPAGKTSYIKAEALWHLPPSPDLCGITELMGKVFFFPLNFNWTWHK